MHQPTYVDPPGIDRGHGGPRRAAALAARPRLRLPGAVPGGRAGQDLSRGLAEALADAPARPRLQDQDRPGAGPSARTLLSVRERELARELGFRWIHIPIVDQRGTNDRAAEEAISDLLDQAAAVLADPANYPLFFHCHHGLNRTSMVQIAYRTKYCGWTLDQAADEIDRIVGLVKVSHGPDYRHMVSFYENRVLPLRREHS